MHEAPLRVGGAFVQYIHASRMVNMLAVHQVGFSELSQAVRAFSQCFLKSTRTPLER